MLLIQQLENPEEGENLLNTVITRGRMFINLFINSALKQQVRKPGL